MTWVVGFASPNVVTLIGDVRITDVVQGVEVQYFGVQKVHYIEPNVLIGFAGNILRGFSMVDDLRRFWSEPSGYADAHSLTNAWFADFLSRWRGGEAVSAC